MKKFFNIVFHSFNRNFHKCFTGEAGAPGIVGMPGMKGDRGVPGIDCTKGIPGPKGKFRTFQFPTAKKELSLILLL